MATWRDEDASRGERFWYNTANHMTRAVYKANNVWTQNPSGWERFRDYNYAPDMLNWVTLNDNGYLAPLEHNDLNQYSSLNGFHPQYDANFNQTTTYSGPTFVYNAQNQAVGGSMQATYDGLGRCLRRTIGGNTILFAYDGWKPVTEYDAGGNLHARNIYGPGPDELLMRGDWSYGWFFYHSDKQGSVNALVDLNGNVVEKYSYDAFGRPTITNADGSGARSWSNYANRFMFTGREWLWQLSVYDYRHRLYNPDTGRFLQTDPMGLQTEGAKLSAGQKALFSPGGAAPEAFAASEMNLYRYGGDDPVDCSDPFGLVPPGAGLLDLPRKTVQEMKEAMKENLTNTETKPAYGPDGKPVKQEFRTTNFTNGSKEQSASTPGGYHPPGSKPTAPLPKDPFNGSGRPTWDTHSHISGSGKPYAPGDINSAKFLRVPSGVQSATGGPMYIFVPSATPGGRGGLFRLEGSHLINEATGREAPH